MGKSSKPLTIVALPPCDQWEELWYLKQKGHTIIRISLTQSQSSVEATIGFHILQDADIIIGENCWRMGPKHKKYLALALREARMLRYPTGEKRADKKLRDLLGASIASDLEPVDPSSPGDPAKTEQS